MSLTKSIKLELFKLKHRYFYLTWLILTVVPIAYQLYVMRNVGTSDRYVIVTPTLLYFYIESMSVEILSLFLPVCASLLISKLCDQEHKGDTWKMLLTSNQDFKTLWWAKFIVVYCLMEITILTFYLIMIFRVNMITSAPIPIKELFLSFIGLSGANIITLTIAEFLAMYFKNQVIVLTEGMLSGFIGIISSLLPQSLIYFIPWGYYALNSLATNGIAGYDTQGLEIWEIYARQPNFLIIYGVSLVFLLLNFLVSRYLSRKEY